MDDARLDEFNADEWFDTMRRVRPDYTREEFDLDWAEFQAMKAAHLRQRTLH